MGSGVRDGKEEKTVLEGCELECGLETMSADGSSEELEIFSPLC